MKITLFIPKIKLCWELKKKKKKETERKNMMLISWKQTVYVPLRRNWTKQYKLSIVLHQGTMDSLVTHSPFVCGFLKAISWNRKNNFLLEKWKKSYKTNVCHFLEVVGVGVDRRQHGVAGRSCKLKNQELILTFSLLKGIITGGGIRDAGRQTSLRSEETAWCCHEGKT